MSESELYKEFGILTRNKDNDRVLLEQAEATGITDGESLTEVSDSEPKEGGEDA